MLIIAVSKFLHLFLFFFGGTFLFLIKESMLCKCVDWCYLFFIFFLKGTWKMQNNYQTKLVYLVQGIQPSHPETCLSQCKNDVTHSKI